MIDYSGLIAFLLLLPVVIQIILPLVMFIGFGLFCVIKAVFGRRKIVARAQEKLRSWEELQFSIN